MSLLRIKLADLARHPAKQVALSFHSHLPGRASHAGARSHSYETWKEQGGTWVLRNCWVPSRLLFTLPPVGKYYPT